MSHGMRALRCAPIVLSALVFVGCAAERDASPPPAAPPPRLPASMQASGSGDHADMSAHAHVSEDVAKGLERLEAGDLEGARASFDAAIKKDARDDRAHHALGVTLDRTGDKAGAERSFREALRIRPDLEAASVDLSAMLIDAERYDDAEKVARDGLAKHDASAPLRMNLGIALAAKGDAAGGRRELEAAVKRTPDDPMARLTAGHWLVVLKQADAAVMHLRAARALAKDDVPLLASIAQELRLGGAFEDCVITFDKAIAVKDTPDLRTERAVCRGAAKDDAGALEDLRAAIQADAKYAPARYYLGNRYASAGKFREAAAEYEAYLKLAPDGPLAKQAKERATIAKQRAKNAKKN